MNTNVLIIDDDAVILEGFKELLAKKGYSVDGAANETQALQALKERAYGVVVTDIVLKETTGIELIPKIKEASSDTAVIMITAYPSIESALRCFRAGAFDYLVKPIKKEDLVAVVARAVESKNEIQEVNSLKKLKEIAEKANNDKTVFLIQVSHDIHMIMDGILGHNELLLKSGVDSKQAENLSAIKAGSFFLRNLADNILDIAKVEAGKLTLKEKDFKLEDVIKDVSRIIYPSIKEKPIQFSYEIQKDVPACLNGDADRLRQILMNLLSNAVKFTKEGEITVKARLMTILGKGCHIFFVVKDTGPGIPKDKQMEVFKPSFQLEKSAGEKQPGVGLGLWICKILVEKMGGLISLHCDPGGGSEFRFSVRFNLCARQPVLGEG